MPAMRAGPQLAVDAAAVGSNRPNAIMGNFDSHAGKPLDEASYWKLATIARIAAGSVTIPECPNPGIMITPTSRRCD